MCAVWDMPTSGLGKMDDPILMGGQEAAKGGKCIPAQ